MSEISTSKIQSLKENLLKLSNEIELSLEGGDQAANTVTLDQSCVGRVSRIDAMQQQAMAQAENKQFELKLKRIKKALKKIDAEDYGFCEDCDEYITIKRLEVQPETELCIDCQEKKEKLI